MRVLNIVALLSIVTAPSCATQPVAAPPPPPVTVKSTPPTALADFPSSAALEAESMKLTNVEKKDLPGASGGKAILFVDENGKAEGTVRLKKGKYEVKLYSQGTDTDHDAVFITVAGTELRFYQEEWNKLASAKIKDVDPVTVEIPGDGAHTVLLAFAESDVYVDRVTLTLVK